MLQDSQRMYNVTLRRVRVTIFLCKSKNITYSECLFVALVNRHATRMRHMLSSATFLAISTVSTFSFKGTIFENKYYWTENLFWFSQQVWSENTSFQTESSEILSKMCIGIHVKCLSFLSYFHENWIFSTHFGKYINIKVRENPSNLEPSCFLRTDRQT